MADVQAQDIARARSRTNIKVGFFLSSPEAMERLRERDARLAARNAVHAPQGRGRVRAPQVLPPPPIPIPKYLAP